MFSSKDTVLLVIDIQEKFRPAISGFDNLISNAAKLIKVFNLLDIPVILTEQYPQGLGDTVPELKKLLEKQLSNTSNIIEKVCFDCFGSEKFIEVIKKNDVKNIVICGIEAHVCVIQTVLSALSSDFNVFVVADAISSRKKPDYDIALKRMTHEGAKIVSTEMIIFRMIKDSKHEKFKEISDIVKH